MRERRCFVQFIHPGGEHQPDESDLKHWNQAHHRRKFLTSEGRWLDHGELHEGELEFWGEWEPESRVVRRYDDSIPDGPRFLYEPFFSRRREPGWRQNTDPFVFGSEFHYTGCLQHTQRGETQLRHLAPGSVILFGSCRQRRRFVIDTVFVVSERHLDHTAASYRQTLKPAVSDVYWAVTGDPWYSAEVNPEQSHRLYFAANYEHPIGGMFSFFPCLPHGAYRSGFARPEITIPGFITSHLFQGKKITRDLNLRELHELWSSVAEQVQQQRLKLGVFAQLPAEQADGQEAPRTSAGRC